MAGAAPGSVTGDQEQVFSEQERTYVPPPPGQPPAAGQTQAPQSHVVRPYNKDDNEPKPQG